MANHAQKAQRKKRVGEKAGRPAGIAENDRRGGILGSPFSGGLHPVTDPAESRLSLT
ncbi:MAG: hypothetical protein ABSH49_26070 [Bryobacteraceae bacterium]|jgi:hypothetical protein